MSSSRPSSSGRTSPEHAQPAPHRLATWNPSRDVWETQTASLFSEHSDAFSETWPASGSMRNGAAFEHPMSAPATGANVSSSLLGTPTASLTHGDGPPLSASHEHRLARGYLDAQILDLMPTVRASSSTGPGAHGDGGWDLQTTVALLPTPTASQWGRYADAVARQEKAFEIPAPAPTEPGRNGTPRLSARFCEWMMGLPDGWICDVPGMTRSESIELAGNGVVPQQAKAALADMLPSITEEAAA